MPGTYRSLRELETGLDTVRRSPAETGTITGIVRRPAVETRERVTTAMLDVEQGLVGDCWRSRGSKRMEDGSADLEAQITVMNSRFATLVAGGDEGWEWAGDQLYVDLDLSAANLPPGTRLAVGQAVLEVSAIPHNGCVKFSGRFGPDALRVASSPEGKALRLRGINTRIVEGGEVRVGDPIRRL